jgi:hypothetical protein
MAASPSLTVPVPQPSLTVSTRLHRPQPSPTVPNRLLSFFIVLNCSKADIGIFPLLFYEKKILIENCFILITRNSVQNNILI